MDFPTASNKRRTPTLLYVDHNAHDQETHFLHMHKSILEIYLIYQGAVRFFLNTLSYHTQPGDVLIGNSGWIHEETFDRGIPYQSYCIGITGLETGDLPENWIIPSDADPLFRGAEEFHQLYALADMIYTCQTRKSLYSENACQSMASALLDLVFQMREHAQPAQKHHSLVHEVLVYLDQNYSDDISLARLAGLFHISEYHLSHLFKRETGYSLIQYVIRRRIGEAQSMLTYTRKSITDIAIDTGFTDSCHLNKLFYKYAGMSPTQYRVLSQQCLYQSQYRLLSNI
ncbi:AraC family transcriptional regulator [Agathobaculum sp.]|uniref:AraC family transcriptional regulator n=1 Tax=Agathobaculum sp. TaxID=2048138 RepID=UPI002A7F41F8|nr:AraC family transcriptional regulator [Agathobaculum sp.]MDY3618994.1 AraC family transcriptional regulator [Agathobaculum sp.]